MASIYTADIGPILLRGTSGTPGTQDVDRVLTPGTYYVRMTSRDYSDEGNYRLKADFEAYPNDEIEPNDEYKDAQRIELGTTVTGVSAIGESHDYYYFEVPEWQEVRIVFNTVQERDSWEYFKLYDGDMIEIKDGGRSKGEVFKDSLDPGIYYIDISWSDGLLYGDSMKDFGSYTLKVGDTNTDAATAAGDAQAAGTQAAGDAQAAGTQAAGGTQTADSAEAVIPAQTAAQ